MKKSLEAKMTWVELEHEFRPHSITDQRYELRSNIEKWGEESAVVGMLINYALAQPEQGSFAGSLWALAEWAKMKIHSAGPLYIPAGKAKVRDPEPYIAEFLEGIVGAVEATSNEGHHLWEYCHRKKKMSWEGGSSGYLSTIGHYGDMPVVLSLYVNIVDGHRILFWHATSQVVDHDMIDKWLEKAIPASAREGGDPEGRINKTDATNFFNILHTANRWREAKKETADV